MDLRTKDNTATEEIEVGINQTRKRSAEGNVERQSVTTLDSPGRVNLELSEEKSDETKARRMKYGDRIFPATGGAMHKVEAGNDEKEGRMRIKGNTVQRRDDMGHRHRDDNRPRQPIITTH